MGCMIRWWRRCDRTAQHKYRYVAQIDRFIDEGVVADQMTKKDPTAEKFLLYIDILGFTEMAIKEPRKVERIFATIDSLNVHQHGAFEGVKKIV